MFLKIGIVGRALGLQGSFYVSGRDEPIPSSIKTVKIGRHLDSAQAAELLKTTWQGGRVAILCSLASDRTSADLLKGMTIWAESSQINVADDKEYLLVDLKGRKVLDVDGECLGLVDDVVKLPASINLIVLNPDKTADVEIPMINDYVDMGFTRGETMIKLRVKRELFDDIWNMRGKKKR